MPCNLIPPALLPVRPHPLPRLLLAASLGLCGVWVVHQTAMAAAGRRRQARCLSELDSLGDQLRVAHERDAQLTQAQGQQQTLRRQAAFVTLLTHRAPPLGPILQAIADATPPSLRLTRVSLGHDGGEYGGMGVEERQTTDPARPSSFPSSTPTLPHSSHSYYSPTPTLLTLSGVGSRERADLEAALFLRAVNEDPVLRRAFADATLEVDPPREARDEGRGSRVEGWKAAGGPAASIFPPTPDPRPSTPVSPSPGDSPEKATRNLPRVPNPREDSCRPFTLVLRACPELVGRVRPSPPSQGVPQ
jgi:hypothetical protein